VAILSLVIFIVSYAVIASEKVNKTIVALLGGATMLILHVLTQEKAFHHIDLNVIFLLVSMMILVKVMEKTGIFQYLAIKFAKKAKGNPITILIVIFLMTAIFSAFLDNVTTVLLLVPISMLIARELRISPMPFLITQILASNIGGTATLIGDPPNIMIGSAAGLTFMDFIINLSPVIIIQLLVFSVIFYYVFRNKMKVSNEDRARIMEFNEKLFIRDRVLLRNSLIVFVLVIIGFMIHGFVHLEAASIALFGAALLVFITKTDIEEVFKEVEWTTIFFFIGLFVMVGGLVENNIIEFASRKILAFTKDDTKLTAEIIIWFSGIASGIVDNIPFVATMIPLIENIGREVGTEAIKPLWWALSLGACLGGNATLVGASANVIVAGLSKKEGHEIGFAKYMLFYGIPVTFLSLLISFVYIIFRYF